MAMTFVINGEKLPPIRYASNIPLLGDVVELSTGDHPDPVHYEVVLVHHKIDTRGMIGRGETLIHLKKMKPILSVKEKKKIEKEVKGE